MKRILILLTACLLLCCALIGTASAQASTLAAGRYSDLNYATGSQRSAMYMGDVLEQLLEEKLTEQEKDAIRYSFNGQNALQYTRPIVFDPEITYDGEKEQLCLVLMDDFNITSSGVPVLWTPVSATIGDYKADFVSAPDAGSNHYRAVFEGFVWTNSVTATITYQASFVISAATLNDFVNFAYDKAVQLDQDYAHYEVALAQYRIALSAYEQNVADWEDYRMELSTYEIYLDRVALYRDYLLKQQYLDDVAQYEQDLKAYNQNQAEWTLYNQRYAKYQAYLTYKAQYPGLLSEYQGKMNTANHQLALLALLEEKDSLTGASFLDRMIDDRMSQVIAENRTELSVVVGTSTVNSAIESATYLQSFCKTYKSLQTEQARYEYYIKEHSNFAKHLGQLYTNVKKIYENGTVYALLQRDHADDIYKMVRMMGSLYVYSCVFDDAKTMNLNAVVDTRGGYKASALVDANLRPASDTNEATPLAAWPTAPVDPETYEVRTAPVKPATLLEEPDAPAIPDFEKAESLDQIPESMESPDPIAEPTPPDQTLVHPGTPPSLAWDSVQQDLYDTYKAGKIVQREQFSLAQTLTVQATANYSATLNEDEHYFFVYFYNTDSEGTYLGSAAVHSGEAAAYPSHLPTPTVPKDQAYSYEFIGWTDADGNPANLDSVTESINVYAAYRTVPREYTVTWDVDGTLYREQYQWGTTPAFKGSVAKTPTAQYSYTFTGWDKSLTSVTSDVTYTAQYSRSLNNYTVTFVRPDGQSADYTYAYGSDLTDLVSSFGVPVKSATAQYTYTFKHWADDRGNAYKEGKDFPIVTGNVTYTAEFDGTLNQYTVTWVVDDQEITEIYEYGEMPVYGDTVGAEPQRAQTAQYTYTFAGWDQEVTAVTKDVVYRAQFDSHVRSYTVQFDIDGKVTSVALEYGEIPAPAEQPYKDSDVQYDYTFIGWDKEFLPVCEDVVYTARFASARRKYPVKFVVEGSELSAEFDYGTVPVYPYGNPTKADDNRYRYTFAGWDRELAAVDGSEVTYTARFDSIALVPSLDGAVGVLNIGADGTYRVQLEGTCADLSLIFQKAGEEGASLLQISFGNAQLIFPKAQVDAIYNMGGGIASVKLLRTTYQDLEAYQIELLDEEGKHVEFLVSELTVMLPYKGTFGADVFHVEDDGTLTKLDSKCQNGYLVFSTMDFSTFAIKEKFAITADAAENGVFEVPSEAYDGDVITITPDPDEGYHVDRVIVLCDGEEIEVQLADGVYSFIMPRGNVQVTTTFKVVEGGTAVEVLVGVIAALLIVAIGIVIAVILGRKKSLKL